MNECSRKLVVFKEYKVKWIHMHCSAADILSVCKPHVAIYLLWAVHSL